MNKDALAKVHDNGSGKTMFNSRNFNLAKSEWVPVYAFFGHFVEGSCQHNRLRVLVQSDLK